MAWEIRQLVLGLHIFLAIIWVGGILFTGWGVFPAARALTFSEQRVFFLSLMKWTHKLFTAAGAGVIVTGILLGTVLGPIHSWEAVWNTKYGQLWVTALIVALITLFWGGLVGYRKSMATFSHETIWACADQGNTTPLTRALITVAMVEFVEVCGFIVLIECMVLI